MNEKVRKLLIVVLSVVAVGCIAAVSISDLINTKDKRTITINEAYSLMAMEHSINGLIPFGTDYYYLGFNGNDAYIIKSSKHWLDENFDENSMSISPEGIAITGLNKKLDYKVSREINNTLEGIEGINYPLGIWSVLKIDYIFYAVARLIILLLMIILAITIIMFGKTKMNENPALQKVWLICFVAVLYLLLWAVR